MSADYATWRDRLADANDAAFWPIAALDAELEAGRAQFWCDGTSAVVTRPVTYPGGAVVVEILSGVGNLSSLWRTIAPEIEKFGREAGAKALYAMGRNGWARASRDEGWRQEMVVIMKDLSA